MQVIKIHYTPSIPVTNWLAIEKEATEMAELIQSQGGMFAIHHSQVNEKPFNFFVLEKEKLAEFVFELGGSVIMNPVIKQYDSKSMMMLDEACVSFPYRRYKKVPRATIITVEYDVHNDNFPQGMEHKEMQVERIIAQIFQHECQHGMGGNIFFNNPKN